MTDPYDEVIVSARFPPAGESNLRWAVLTHCRTLEEAQVTRALFEAAGEAIRLLNEMHTQSYDVGGVDPGVLNDAADLLEALAEAGVKS